VKFESKLLQVEERLAQLSARLNQAIPQSSAPQPSAAFPYFTQNLIQPTFYQPPAVPPTIYIGGQSAQNSNSPSTYNVPSSSHEIEAEEIIDDAAKTSFGGFLLKTAVVLALAWVAFLVGQQFAMH
jgi:hypothetical protein